MSDLIFCWDGTKFREKKLGYRIFINPFQPFYNGTYIGVQSYKQNSKTLWNSIKTLKIIG